MLVAFLIPFNWTTGVIDASGQSQIIWGLLGAFETQTMKTIYLGASSDIPAPPVSRFLSVANSFTPQKLLRAQSMQLALA